jgi:methionyl-tRNA formyltransferase
MPHHLVFLTGTFDAGDLARFLAQRRPACTVDWVQDVDGIAAALARAGESRSRLVSFCSGVIVPASLLARFGHGAYNIHPGPPSVPGRHPECWGVYHAVERFGATLHVMAPRVDEGAIVDTRWFDVAPGTGQRILAEAAFKAALDLLLYWADSLIGDAPPLPVNGEIWRGRKWRRADLDAITRLPADIGFAEFERRRRAFAELPGCTLTVSLHGREFVYTVPPDPE